MTENTAQLKVIGVMLPLKMQGVPADGHALPRFCCSPETNWTTIFSFLIGLALDMNRRPSRWIMLGLPQHFAGDGGYIAFPKQNEP
jgi:hypothetical protein